MRSSRRATDAMRVVPTETTGHENTGTAFETDPGSRASTHPQPAPHQNCHAATSFSEAGRAAENPFLARARNTASPEIQLQSDVACGARQPVATM